MRSCRSTAVKNIINDYSQQQLVVPFYDREKKYTFFFRSIPTLRIYGDVHSDLF